MSGMSKNICPYRICEKGEEYRVVNGSWKFKVLDRTDLGIKIGYNTPIGYTENFIKFNDEKIIDIIQKV